MTPDNDKTLRGIFRPVQFGHTEWNDRRSYRLKYEDQFHIGQKGKRENSPIQAIMHDTTIRTIIHDTHNELEEDRYYQLLLKCFPECSAVKQYIHQMTFGYGRNDDGGYLTCDCCGIQLHALNTFSSSLCDKCSTEISSDQEYTDEPENAYADFIKE